MNRSFTKFDLRCGLNFKLTFLITFNCWNWGGKASKRRPKELFFSKVVVLVLKASNKIVWSNVFSYVKLFTFWKCIQHTIHWNKTEKLRKFPSDKVNGTKQALFFRELQFIRFLLLTCDSSMSWSTRFVSLKLWVFRVLIPSRFCPTKSMDSLKL